MAKSVLLVVLNENEAGTTPDWVKQLATADQAVVSASRADSAKPMDKKEPAQLRRAVARAPRPHGRCGPRVGRDRRGEVSRGRLVGATGERTHPFTLPGGAGRRDRGLRCRAEPRLENVTLVSPPASHMDVGAAISQCLSRLRRPDALGLLAPHSLTLMGVNADHFTQTAAAYAAVGRNDRLSIPE